jgi:glycosyltransferase involved in cell wall biosynthesis
MRSKPHNQYFLATMVRNEADILPYFLRRAAQLFDHIILVDHRSTDGSREICKQAAEFGAPLSVFTFQYQGYYQQQISRAASKLAFERGASWVLFLDADEILDIDDRTSLARQLRQAEEVGIALFPWKNCIPLRYGSFRSIPLEDGYWAPQKTSKYCKIGIHSKIARQHPDYLIHMGNHAISARSDLPPLEGTIAGEILHFPIRSLDRLIFKLQSGCDAYRALANPRGMNGFHWFQMLELMKLRNNELSNEQLNWIIANYGELMSELRDFDPAMDSGWRTRRGIKPFYTEDGREFTEVLSLERSVRWQGYEKESPRELSLEPLSDSSMDREPSPRAGVRPFSIASTTGRWLDRLRLR